MLVVRLRDDYVHTIRILVAEDIRTPDALLCVIGEIAEGISTSTGQDSLKAQKSRTSDVSVF